MIESQRRDKQRRRSSETTDDAGGAQVEAGRVWATPPGDPHGGGRLRVSVEKGGRFWDRYWIAKNSATGMTAYGKSPTLALISLVKSHSLMIDALKKRQQERL